MSDHNSERPLPALLPALALLGSFAILLFVLLPQPVSQPAGITPTATELPPTPIPATPTSLPPTAVAAAYDPDVILQGQNIFQTNCVACHGLNGRGMPGLGKDLIDSEFVHGLTDAELLQFIIVGRDISDPLNTTGIPMPARGGNPSLTDEQINAIIAYLRSEAGAASAVAQSAPTTMPTVAAPQNTPILPTSIPVTVQPFTAASAYDWSCAGCHGADGSGSEPYGPGFLDSALLKDREALVAFLTQSNPPVDPAVEYPHPVRGGYPLLTDEQIAELADYVIEFAGQ
jgi:mono/diheme cytochrome c family protein